MVSFKKIMILLEFKSKANEQRYKTQPTHRL